MKQAQEDGQEGWGPRETPAEVGVQVRQEHLEPLDKQTPQDLQDRLDAPVHQVQLEELEHQVQLEQLERQVQRAVQDPQDLQEQQVQQEARVLLAHQALQEELALWEQTEK